MALSRIHIDEEYNRRAVHPGGIHAVLDATDSDDSRLQNIYRDYATKHIMKRALNVLPTDRVLDFGCGVGRLTNYFSKHTKDIIGIDRSPQMIEAAIKLYPSCNFRHSADIQLPFENNSFTKVFICLVQVHMSNEEIALAYREFFRLLKPNGQLIFLEHTSKQGTEVSDIHVQRRQNEYVQLAEHNGFTIHSVKHILRFPSYGMNVWKQFSFLGNLILPLCFFVEQVTVNRKPDVAGYYSDLFIFDQTEPPSSS